MSAIPGEFSLLPDSRISTLELYPQSYPNHNTVEKQHVYAIVKFTDETSSRIVSTEDIKNLDPEAISKKKFLVKFTDGYFYPAQVLLIKDTIEELEIYKAQNRLHYPNKNLMDSATESEAEDTPKKAKKKLFLSENEKSKNKRVQSKNDLLMKSIINSYDKTQKNTQSSSCASNNNLEMNFYDKSKNTQSSCASNNNMEMNFYDKSKNTQSSCASKNDMDMEFYVRSTCASINEMEMNSHDKLKNVQSSSSNEMEMNFYDKKKNAENKSCSCGENTKRYKRQIEDLQIQNKELLMLNMNLQNEIIGNFQKYFANIDEDKVKKIGQVVKEQVHLGREVFIPKTAFNDAWFRSTSGPHFVKMIALYLFGSETLINSSVTGKSSNNFKKGIKKPKLDPNKLAAIEDIYKYYLREKEPEKNVVQEIIIASKMSDLIRTQENKNKKKAEVSETADQDIEAVNQDLGWDMGDEVDAADGITGSDDGSD